MADHRFHSFVISSTWKVCKWWWNWSCVYNRINNRALCK